jgi:hypothetical protein
METALRAALLATRLGLAAGWASDVLADAGRPRERSDGGGDHRGL